MREELLSKKESDLDDLGNYQPIQITKDTKIRRFTVRKVCSAEKAECVDGHFASAYEGSKDQSKQFSQRAL